MLKRIAAAVLVAGIASVLGPISLAAASDATQVEGDAPAFSAVLTTDCTDPVYPVSLEVQSLSGQHAFNLGSGSPLSLSAEDGPRTLKSAGGDWNYQVWEQAGRYSALGKQVADEHGTACLPEPQVRSVVYEPQPFASEPKKLPGSPAATAYAVIPQEPPTPTVPCATCGPKGRGDGVGPWSQVDFTCPPQVAVAGFWVSLGVGKQTTGGAVSFTVNGEAGPTVQPGKEGVHFVPHAPDGSTTTISIVAKQGDKVIWTKTHEKTCVCPGQPTTTIPPTTPPSTTPTTTPPASSVPSSPTPTPSTVPQNFGTLPATGPTGPHPGLLVAIGAGLLILGLFLYATRPPRAVR